MAIKASIESELHELGAHPETIYQGSLYFYLDTTIGRLILAKSLSDNEGGLVHIAEGIHCSDEDLTRDLVLSLAKPQYLHKELMPWCGVKLPIHLDGGEPAELTIRHQPDMLAIHLIRPHRSLD